MSQSQLYLFKDRRFLPLFITQLCGCFNDCLLKNALIILVVYKLFINSPDVASLLVLLANALFTIPFIFLAGLSGQLADKFERSTIAKFVKFSEIIIVALALYGFFNDALSVLFICIGLMGVHSTFFGPIKYSILPDHLKKHELLSANGYIEAATFMAILIGTIFGGFYNYYNHFVLIIMSAVVFIGFISSFYIPKSNNYNPVITINKNILQEAWNLTTYSYRKKIIFLAILGNSWFWFIGASFLSQIPSLTKHILGADEYVANFFFALFSIGVGVGSFFCSRLLSNEVTTKYVFISAIFMSVFGIDLFFATKISSVSYELEHLKSLSVFLSKLHNWRIVLDLFLLSVVGGLYVVPLYAVMQHFSASTRRSRVIAANNIFNSLFMVASTIILSLLFALGCSVHFVILIVSLLNLFIAGYIYSFSPESVVIPEYILRKFFKFLFTTFYKVKVNGLENFHAVKNGKIIVIANHESYLDPPLISVYLPEKLRFAINTTVSNFCWVKPFLKIVKAYPIDPTNPMATKNLINDLKKGKKIGIFPEGRASITGTIMKVYEGTALIADQADATFLPIHIEGAKHTHFSKCKSLPKRWFAKVSINIFPAVKLTADSSLSSRERRKVISDKLYNLMCSLSVESHQYQNLYSIVLENNYLHEKNNTIVEDFDGNKLTYKSLIMKSFALSEAIAKYSDEKDYVGIMLPNTVATVVLFFSMQLRNFVPTMINFSTGISNTLTSCKTTCLKVIYTSRRFVEKANLYDLVDHLSKQLKIIYLEDLREEISLSTKLKALFASWFPNHFIQPKQKADDPLVALFTSGTEGVPKTVILSQKNLMSNVRQVMARLDFNPHDNIFNALPMFHSFGLGVTMISVLNGIKVSLYPSPLHYRIIPEEIYDKANTVLFATDTFLNGYAMSAHPYDFNSLRYVFAGAEKLKTKTVDLWFEKFGIRILEGYGATETSPVISFNTRMYNKLNSSGKIMSNIEYHIEKVEGIDEGGKLYVKGPNVMKGYMLSNNPGIIQPTKSTMGEGWYDTGDIVKLDDNGYLEIVGRVKRFAKIGGEMISLGLVEEISKKVDSTSNNAAIYVLDDRKGEQIILYTDSKIINREKLLATLKESLLTELYLPKQIIQIDKIPVLSTGKIDYQSLQKLKID